MKFLSSLLFVFVFFISNTFFAQVVSFHSNLIFGGTDVGIKFGNFIPYIGLDVTTVDFSFEEKSTFYRSTSDNILRVYNDDFSSAEISGALFMPRIGGKYILSFASLVTYVRGEFMLVVPSVEGTQYDKEIYYNEFGQVEDFYEDEDKLPNGDSEDYINPIMGIGIGFGIEYPFSNNFTVGGEFGFKYNFYSGSSSDRDESDIGGIYRWKDEWQDELDASIGLTYTSLSLNYYF